MKKTAPILALSVTLVFAAGAAAQAPAPSDSAQHADHLEHSFADVDRYAKVFDDPTRDAWQLPDRVIAALGLKAGQVVADIGAGTGYFSVRLAKATAAPKVYAVDIEPTMVEHVRHRAMSEGLKNIVAVKAAADRSNLPEPVDVGPMVDTYHHISNRVAYFTALRALMKPGARVAIIDFKTTAPEGPPLEFRYTPAQISTELGKAGFTLRAQHDFLPRQLFLVYSAN